MQLRGAPVLPDQTILELLPAAICIYDGSGALVRCNRKAAELLEGQPCEAGRSELYDGAYQLLWPDGRPIARSKTPMADAIRSGRAQQDVEIVIEQPAGRRVWVSASVTPLRSQSGEITGAISCFHDITPRKQARRELEQSQALLEAIFETTPDCVKIVARDGTLLRMNAAGLRMLEADDWAEVEGLCAIDLVAPEHRAHWQAHHERVCNGERLSWTFDIIGLHGTRRHMEAHAVPLAWPDGSHVQLSTARDVTRRVRDERILRESEGRLRELLEALPTAIYTTDAEGRVTFYNQAAVDLSGREPELGSDRWCVTWRLHRPDGTYLPHDQCPMALAIQEQRPIRGAEAVAERPDGTRVPFLAYPTPLFDSLGNLAGAVNMLVDISDRHRAEQYAQRLATIVEFSDDAIVSKNTSGVIQTWNKGAERLFGYTAAEAVGKPVNILIPPDRQDEEPAILARIRRGERIDHYETVRVRKDGTLLDISLTVSPLKNAAGRIVGASKIARDITARKREDERRQLLVNELNHRVKNTLAAVQSIAAQTFRGDGCSKEPKEFESRLVALSRAHDVLTRESWVSAELDQLIREVATPICGEPEAHLQLSGPSVRLKPKTALSFSMAIHELCTNAAKYGALTNDRGRVAVTWGIGGSEGRRSLHLRWEESGGPEVEPPSRTGFGTRLLERALARELGAEVRLSFPPSGAICEIEAPL